MSAIHKNGVAGWRSQRPTLQKKDVTTASTPQGWESTYIFTRCNNSTVLRKNDGATSISLLKDLVWQDERSRRRLFTKTDETGSIDSTRMTITRSAFTNKTWYSTVLREDDGSMSILEELLWQAWRSHRQPFTNKMEQQPSFSTRTTFNFHQASFSTRTMVKELVWQAWRIFTRMMEHQRVGVHDEVVVSHFTKKQMRHNIDRLHKDDIQLSQTRCNKHRSPHQHERVGVTSMTKSSSISQAWCDDTRLFNNNIVLHKSDEGEIDLSSQRVGVTRDDEVVVSGVTTDDFEHLHFQEQDVTTRSFSTRRLVVTSMLVLKELVTRWRSRRQLFTSMVWQSIDIGISYSQNKM